MLILHIGLGKTGTTSLQKHLFPKLKALDLIDEYNPPQLIEQLKSYMLIQDGAASLKKTIHNLPKRTLVSLESLAGWNPENWSSNLKKIKEVYPKNTKILITLRDHKSYLRSVYVQMVKTNLMLEPEEFFLPDSVYKKAKNLFPENTYSIFNVDKFRYKSLESGYKTYFASVTVVPLESLNGLHFLSPLLGVTASVPEQLASFLKEKPRENLAFSKFAVELTLLRNSVLGLFGLGPILPAHRNTRNILSKLKRNPAGGKEVSFLAKLVSRLKRRALNRFIWRRLLEKLPIHNQFFPKYELPEDLFLGRYFLENERFYQELVKKNGEG